MKKTKKLGFHWHNNIPMATMFHKTIKIIKAKPLTSMCYLFLLLETLLFVVLLCVGKLSQGAYIVATALSLFKFVINFYLADYIEAMLKIIRQLENHPFLN